MLRWYSTNRPPPTAGAGALASPTHPQSSAEEWPGATRITSPSTFCFFSCHSQRRSCRNGGDRAFLLVLTTLGLGKDPWGLRRGGGFSHTADRLPRRSAHFRHVLGVIQIVETPLFPCFFLCSHAASPCLQRWERRWRGGSGCIRGNI